MTSVIGRTNERANGKPENITLPLASPARRKQRYTQLGMTTYQMYLSS